MPKKRKPAETFDEFIGAVIDSRRALNGMSQDDLAAAVGIPLTNMGRSLRGSRPLSVNEFERIAGALGEDAGEMAAEALRRFGGMEKLLAGYVSEGSRSVDPADEIPYIGQVTPPLDAAANDNPRAPEQD